MLALLLILAALFVLIPAGLVTGGVTAARRRRARRTVLAVLQVTPPGESWRPAMSAPGPIRGYPSRAPYPPGGHAASLLTYLQGGPVGFGEAIKLGLSNGFVYRGRASRSAFWWFNLFLGIVGFALPAIILIAVALNSGAGIIAFLVIGAFVLIYLELALLALYVRRLHDIGKPGWWVLIGLVPFAGPDRPFRLHPARRDAWAQQLPTVAPRGSRSE